MSTTTHRLWKAEDLFDLPDDHRYELVKGELLTMSPAGAEHGAVIINLSVLLANYIKANNLGVVFSADTGFKLESNPDTVLAPDIAFVAASRLSLLPKGFLDLAPDLVVEVVSPGETQVTARKKASQWLVLGARLVWLVKPKNKTVEVHCENQIQVLTATDMLEGKEVVPGFSISVSKIFE